MKFKLLLVLVEDTRVDAVLEAAREAGATGATVITSARGEGLVPKKTFLGLDLVDLRDVVLLVVEEHLSARILQKVATVGCFDTEHGSGIAIQLPVEETIGLGGQIKEISQRTGDRP
jgi:PII-like signaling protein